MDDSDPDSGRGALRSDRKTARVSLRCARVPICIAYASALLAWKLLPDAHRLTACLIPFILASSGMTLLCAAKEKQADWWREPLAEMALLAIALGFADSLSALSVHTFGPQIGVPLLLLSFSALLIFLARRSTKWDSVRIAAAVALFAASALDVFAFGGLPLHAPARLARSAESSCCSAGHGGCSVKRSRGAKMRSEA